MPTIFRYRQRAASATVTFALTQYSATNALPHDNNTTPATFAAGDCKISKDGAAFANTTNLPTHIGQGVYTLTLTSTETDCGYADVALIDQTVPHV